MVVRLRVAKCVALPAQVATKSKRDEITGNVRVRNVISSFFDIGLFVAIGGWVLGVAFASLFRPKRIAT